MKYVTNLGFAADMGYLITVHSGFDEDQITLWNPENGLQLNTLPVEGDGIIGVSCSPDRQHILAADVSGIAFLWQMDKHNIVAYQKIVLEDVEEVTALGFSSDGQYAFIAMDSYVKIWQMPNWTEVNALSGYANAQPTAAFVPGQRSIVIGDAYKVDHRDIVTGRIIQQVKVGNEPIAKICFSAADDVCYVWDATAIYIWNLLKNDLVPFPNPNTLDQPCTDGDISRDGTILVSIFGNKVCTLNTTSRKVLQQFVGHTAQVIKVIFSPNAKYVLTGSEDGTARLWDTTSGIELKRFG